MARVALYARVSTDEQAKHGTSLESQIERLRAHELGRDRAATLLEYREDASGKDIVNRPTLTKLLADVRAGLVDRIAVTKADRLARNHKHHFVLLEQFEEAGVDIAFTEEGDDITTESGELVNMIKAWMAAKERRLIRERTHGGRLALGRKGIYPAGKVPYGFQRRADGYLQAVEPAASEIRMVLHKLTHERLPLRSIVAAMRAEGYPGPTGKGWSRAGIRKLVRMTCYRGTWTYNVLQARGKTKVASPPDAVCSGSCDVIVSAELHAKAARQLAENRDKLHGRQGRPQEIVSAFRRLMLCGACGRRMRVHQAGSHGGGPLYRCSSRADLLSCAGRRSYGMQRVDRICTEALLAILANPARLKKAAELRSRTELASYEKSLKQWRKRQDEAQAQYERLIDFATRYGADETTDKRVRTCKDTLRESDAMVRHFEERVARADIGSFEAMAAQVQSRIKAGLSDDIKREIVTRIIDYVKLEGSKATMGVRVPVLLATPMKQRSQYNSAQLAEKPQGRTRPLLTDTAVVPVVVAL